MKKIFIKFMLIIPALAGLFLLASIPNFSSIANDKNFWYLTEDEIIVDETIHDFGTIKESEGTVSAIFTITNNTKKPVLLNHVSTSCGCTVPNWTKEPVEPGKTGKVTAIYDPKGRPGAFEKTITIMTSGKPERIGVRIKGIVERE